MIYKNVNLPIFPIIKRNILNNLSDVIKEENLYFKTVTIITGNFGESLVSDRQIGKQFPKTHIINIKKYKNISEIRTQVVNNKTELILAIGGGTIIDIGKYLSVETSIPLISIPTILSNDGIASPISILKINGKYKSLGTTPPIGVIADTEIITKSPKKFLLSGLGDLMSNISAILDWELSAKETGEKLDFFAKNIAYNSASNLLYNFKIGKYENNIYDKSFIEDLFNGLVMSAVSMIIAKSSRPASGAEHNISHALDRLGNHEAHGIQVGFSTLFTLYLQNEYKILEDTINLYKGMGFPIAFDKLKFTEQDFKKAFELAPHIRDRYTILNRFSFNNLLKKFEDFKRVVYNEENFKQDR